MKLNKTRRVWQGRAYTFTPRLLTRQFGDGQRYLAMMPLNYRPYFYVVRVDSTWGDAEIDGGVEEIWDAIEDEFGPCCETQSSTGECECDGEKALPACKGYEGCQWYFLNGNRLKALMKGIQS